MKLLKALSKTIFFEFFDFKNLPIFQESWVSPAHQPAPLSAVQRAGGASSDQHTLSAAVRTILRGRSLPIWATTATQRCDTGIVFGLVSILMSSWNWLNVDASSVELQWNRFRISTYEPADDKVEGPSTPSALQHALVISCHLEIGFIVKLEVSFKIVFASKKRIYNDGEKGKKIAIENNWRW